MAELFTTSLFNDANLVSYYRLEDANDSKGANNLTNNGSVAFNPAKFNNGADFGNPNTTPKYLSLASNLGIDGGSVSIGGWFKLSTESQTAYLVSQQSSTSKVGYFLEYLVNSGSGTQTLVFKRLQNGTTEVISTYACGSLGTSTYHFVVGTYDGVNTKIYVDGVLRDTQAASGSGSSALPSDFEIGNRSAGNPGFAGIIDDVFIFSRALTLAEVVSIYGTTVLGFNPITNGHGYVQSHNVSTWATARADNPALNVVQNSTGIYTTFSGGPVYNNIRIFLPFNTTSLPVTATILSATLQIYRDDSISAFGNADGTAAHVIQTTEASTSNLQLSDYNNVNFVSGGSTNLSASANNSYLTITLNATGLSWLTAGGISKLGVLTGLDLNNVAPTGTNNLSVQSGTGSNKPTLVVTYSLPVTGAGFFLGLI